MTQILFYMVIVAELCHRSSLIPKDKVLVWNFQSELDALSLRCGRREKYVYGT